MKNWTVRQRITWSFGAVIVLMIAMGAFAFTRLATIEQETTDVQKDSVPGLYYSDQLMTDWLDTFSLAQRHVLAADRIEKQKIAALLDAQRIRVDNSVKAYEATITTAKDRQLTDVFKSQRGPYARIQEEVIRLSDAQDSKAAAALIGTQLEPEFEKTQASIQALLEGNKADTDSSTALIVNTISAAKTGLLVVMGVVLLLALVSGYSLVQAINQPLSRLVGVTEAMRQADFTKRVTLDRQDEFATLGDGFNRMADDLTALVGQVQQSGIQVNTSVNEIAATAKVR